MSFHLTTTKFIATVALALAVIFGGAFAVTTVTAQAVTTAELVELFISLGIISADKADAARAAIAGSTTGGTTGGATCSTTFTRNLKQGDSGAEVMDVQKFLNNNGFPVAASGAGSPGNETSYFGPATKQAVINFQNTYAAEVLTPVGLTVGSGYWGASSRAQANSMCSTGNTGGNTGNTGTGMLNVGNTTQPVNSLAPQGASRVPFTKFTLTNNSSAAVTVTGVTVQLEGLAVNAVFAGVTLVDSNNVQYGIAKTLNSNHQAVIGDTFTLNAGETKTFTVAGNMAAALTNYAGQVAALSVVGINTSATVSGSLPIIGAYQTMNASLSIGEVSTSTSAYDPGAAQNKNIGDSSVRFSGLRFTASSAEDVRLYSVRWRNSGTASASDITNLMMYVDGVAYPVSVDSTGKYYTAVISGGLLIEKGFSKDVYLQGDITGSGAAGRTVIFDIDKASDVYFVGQTYGYGIAVSGSYSPWFAGYTTTVLAGTATSIAKANEVPAQNVAVNVQNEVLGGFATEFKGESVSVQSILFTLATSSTGNGAPTSVSLINENGVVVAGPTDFVTTGSSATLTLADTVTFPTGRHVYTLKGKLPSTWSNNGTFYITTVPSSGWSTPTGQTSGNSITLPSTTVTMNTMTVKAGSVVLSVSPTPAAQSVVAGVTGFTVANVQFDATQSGEDVRFANMRVYYTDTSAAPLDPVNCFVYDGATRLSDTAVNPDGTGDDTYTFSSNLIVSKGTVKTVAVKCDIPAAADNNDQFSFGMNGTVGFTGTGVQSGQGITPTISATQAGQTMTISTGGTLKVYEDASSPAYMVAAGGTSGVTLGVLRFEATNEDITLQRIALQMSNVAATSTPSDITQVTLWDGATQIGSAIFTGTSRNATSSLTTTVTIPKDGSKLITVKGNLAAIGTGQSGDSGVLIQIDYDNDDSTGTHGLGQASGSGVDRTSTSDSSFDGVRMFKSYPTIAQLATPTLTLSAGNDQELTRFSMTANSAGPVAVEELTINIATSSASAVSGTTTVTDMKIYAYTDAGFTSPVSGWTGGLIYDGGEGLLDGDNEISIDTNSITIPAGTTYYFKVVADIALTAGSGTFSGYVNTYLVGDAAFPIGEATLMLDLSNADATATNDNFIWSPLSTTTTPADANLDWTNGYGLPGLPSTGLSGTRLTK